MLIFTKEIGVVCEAKDEGALYQGVWFLEAHLYFSHFVAYKALYFHDLKTCSSWSALGGRISRKEVMFRFLFHSSQILNGQKGLSDCVGIFYSTYKRSLTIFRIFFSEFKCLMRRLNQSQVSL